MDSIRGLREIAYANGAERDPGQTTASDKPSRDHSANAS